MQRIEHNLNVLDEHGNEMIGTTEPASLTLCSDVLIVEVAGVTIYVERQTNVVGVYVGRGDDGRSDAMLSLRQRVDEPEDDASLRYDGSRIVIESHRSA